MAVAVGPLAASHASGDFSLSLGLDADVLPDVPGVQRLNVQLGLHEEGWRVEGIRTALPVKSSDQVPPAVNPRDVGAAWALTHAPVQHLAFVFADIDADRDLDVIVVNRYKGTAESVWRNRGAGHLERLHQHHYGTVRFPVHHVTGTGHIAGSVTLLAAGAAFPLWSRRNPTTLRQQVDSAPETLTSAPTSPFSGAAPSRGPPQLG